jgi:hypothetical protein
MTSIEWLDEQIQEYVIAVDHIANTMVIQISFEEYMDFKRQAKEMHKQEIIDAATWGTLHETADKYYQETFVSKGTYVNGDIVTKDSVINELPTTTSDLIDSTIWSLPFEERMKCWDLIEKLVDESQLPQQEISDEEIEKRVKEVGAMGEYYKWGYKDAIIWYKEQLKQKL